MRADRALLGSLFALENGAAVAALPAVFAYTLPDFTLLDVLNELAVPFFVMRLDFGHLGKENRKLFEAFGLGLFGETLVHIGPLLVLAGGGREQIGLGVGDAVKSLEPKLGVLLFIKRRFLEDGRDLLVAFLLRLGGEIIVFVAVLRLPGKRIPEILLGLATFQFHISKLPMPPT